MVFTKKNIKTMELKKLKNEVEQWSGFSFEGKTQQELKDNLKTIHWSLECELSEERNAFYRRIEKLDIPEE